MKKIITSEDTRKLDQYTIAHEPILSANLMERAATQFTEWLERNLNPNSCIKVFCGTGNNGGDGLVVARLLIQKGFAVKVFVVRFSKKESPDFQLNLQRLSRLTDILQIHQEEDFPELKPLTTIVDAIFGSGLNRPVEGMPVSLIDHLNKSGAPIFSIDIPSGLFSDEVTEGGAVIRAEQTLAFQLPKISFFFPENAKYVGDWSLRDIGLHPGYLQKVETDHFYFEKKDARQLLKVRGKFSHKGNFGHVLVMGGSYGKIGAVVLSAKAALRTGAGLVTTYVPACGYAILQANVPEAMCLTDPSEKHISNLPDLEAFTTVVVGPGLGQDKETKKAFIKLLDSTDQPIIVDADGLNLLSSDKSLLKKLPKNSILTPHPGEFRKMVGDWRNDFQRLSLLKELAKETNSVVVLKGAYTSTATPEGKVFFNSSGNPGMATGGSGDTLTGIIAAFTSQGYAPWEAAVLGVYIHGLAADLALEDQSEESLIASDIIQALGKAFANIRESKENLLGS